VFQADRKGRPYYTTMSYSRAMRLWYTLCPDAVDEAIDGYEKKALSQGWFLIIEIEATVGPALTEKFLTST
jgi:hypothetical protein